MIRTKNFQQEICEARESWLSAKKISTDKSSELFKEGTGFGNPSDRYNAEQEVHKYRMLEKDAYEYLKDIEKKESDYKIQKLQKSEKILKIIVAIFSVITVVLNCFKCIK